jgi:hypothetical protein
MSPETITLSSLVVAKLQLWVIALSIILGFLAGAILIFLMQYQNNILAEKQKLFIALMAERKEMAISPELVKSLNTIDVVFSNNPHIVKLWHNYYDALLHPSGSKKNHIWLEMLKEMANELRYSNLKQADLDKFYISSGDVDDAEFHRNSTIQCYQNIENIERSLLEELSYTEGLTK